VAYLLLTCPSGHRFELTLFNFPQGERITIAKCIETECLVCDASTAVPAGSYEATGREVRYTPQREDGGLSVNYVVTITSTGAPLGSPQIAQLATTLGAMTSGVVGDRRCDTTFTIEATNPLAAGRMAMDRVRGVRGDVEVDLLEVLTFAESDRQLATSSADV
jgi:hypothetical protein